jgi:hypothetical protein
MTGTWRELGTIVPTGNWQKFQFSTTGEVFKLTQTWNSQDYWRPRGLISQIFEGNQTYGLKKVWAREGTSLLWLKVPDPLKQAGMLEREIAFLLITPYYPMSANYQWEIRAEVLDVGARADDLDTYRETFNVTDSEGGIFDINHGLGDVPSSVTVVDEFGEYVEPDSIRIVDDNTIEVDLTSYGDFDGDWMINVEG